MGTESINLTAKLPEVLIQLREATRQDHRRLDHHPELQRLILPGLSMAGYAQTLMVMYWPQAGLERAVMQGAEQLGDSGRLSPMRLPCLEADLENLNLEAPSQPAGFALPAAPTLPALMGQRYVLEGSRLGAEVLTQSIRRALGECIPLAFFSAPEGRKHWQDFMEEAGECCSSDVAQGEAVTAARQTFAFYYCGLVLGSSRIRQ